MRGKWENRLLDLNCRIKKMFKKEIRIFMGNFTPF